MDQVLDRLIEVVADADDLEAQVRPLLELLQSVTGLESTYLTAVHLERDEQEIVFASNRAPERFEIPEGLHVAWGDTLCKRALDEGRPFCDDVAGQWGDSEAARELGVATYLSEPVRIGDGELYGTLCAASGERHEVPEQARRLLRMFAALVARQVERDQLLVRLRAERRAFATAAMTDALTGLPNRRALTEALTRALANAARGAPSVVVAFADLDGFKQVNDRFGHDAGDRFLTQVARRWRDGLRHRDPSGGRCRGAPRARRGARDRRLRPGRRPPRLRRSERGRRRLDRRRRGRRRGAAPGRPRDVRGQAGAGAQSLGACSRRVRRATIGRRADGPTDARARRRSARRTEHAPTR
jgi:diguanylate cyclase